MIKNVKFSGYYFHMNTNLQGDFQICISVSLNETGRKVKLSIALILLRIYLLPHEPGLTFNCQALFFILL